MKVSIVIARSDREISDCYPVMAQLRPHFKCEDFTSKVKQLAETTDFQLVYLADGDIKAVGGFRVSEWLGGGKYLEIEDLVTAENERSKGYGGHLFDWIIDYARECDCDQVRLVSHVRRFGAHRFYLSKRMIIEAHYFSMSLK
jgi:GNAT superfamily N-acetyltransferase